MRAGTKTRNILCFNFISAVLIFLNCYFYTPPFLIIPAILSFLYLALSTAELQSFKKCALCFFSFTLFVDLLLFHWIIETSREFLNLSGLLAILFTLAVLLFYAAVSLLSGICFWYWRRLISKWSTNRVLWELTLLIPFFVVWDLFELRPPQLSYATLTFVLAQEILPAVSILGALGCALLFWGTMIPFTYLLLKPGGFGRSFTLLLISSSSVGLSLYIGNYSRESLQAKFLKSTRVALIQDNQTITLSQARGPASLVSMKLKGIESIHQRLVDRLVEEGAAGPSADWIFWPETLSDLRIEKPDTAGKLCSWAKQVGSPMLAGAIQYEETSDAGSQRRYNVAALCHPQGETMLYKKRLLVPFAEFMPLANSFPWLSTFLPVERRLDTGQELNPLNANRAGEPLFLPAICYEVMFDSHIGEFLKLTEDIYPTQPRVLTIIAADSALGGSIAPKLYSMLIRWQAAKYALPTIKTSDTGFSQVIAPWGEIIESSKLNSEELIYADLPLPG